MSDNQAVTPEFRELLRHTFGIKKGLPIAPAALPIHATIPKPKTVGVDVSAAAQRIYNPDLPPVPPKLPPKAVADKGSAVAMDLTQPWGGAPE